MKLYLDFEPCNECREMMHELGSEEILFADDIHGQMHQQNFLGI